MNNIFLLGNKSAEILVVCDMLSKDSFNKSLAISTQHLNLFAEAAKKYSFEKEDFCFINIGPVVPDELQKATPKKKRDYVLSFREEFLSVYNTLSPKITLLLGANAGLQVLGKEIKITKERGVVKEYIEGKQFLPMLSPGHVLKQPEVKDIFISDFNMLKRLKNSKYSNELANESTIELKYEWRDDISDLLVNRPKIISFDTETTGLQWYKPSVVPITFQMSYEPGMAIVSCVNPVYKDISPEKLKTLISQWKDLLEDPKILKVGHNIQYDNHIARKVGINIKGWAFDTLLMAHALDENMLTKNLEECCRRWIPEMAGYKDFYNNTLDKSNMMGVSYEDMLMYGGGDADASYRLAKVLYDLLIQDKRQYNVYKRITLPATLAFGNIVEKYGIRIDEQALENLGVVFKKRAKELEEEMFDMIPTFIKQKHIDNLKLTRSKLLVDILFTEEGFALEPKKFTESAKEPATNEEHLKMFEGHEFVDKLLEFKKLQKMTSTYVGVKYDEKKKGPTGFWKYIFEGRIRPSYSLYTTVTGRTSSNNPNGQNLPSRGALAKEYKKIFLPTEGYKFLSGDMSQCELRIAAWISQDKTMLKIYNEGKDIHKVVGAASHFFEEIDFEKPIDFYVLEDLLVKFGLLPIPIQKQDRQRAKGISFGLVYDMRPESLVSYIKTNYGVIISIEQAKDFYKMFFSMFPALKSWHTAVTEFVQKNGYVRSLHGALRRLPHINSDNFWVRNEAIRAAINSPVQKFGSDIGLMAMIRLTRDVDPELMRPVAFIHDALVIEVREDYAMEGAEALKFYMEDVKPFKDWFGLVPPLPIVADVSIGDNLSGMEELKLEAKAPSWYDPSKD